MNRYGFKISLILIVALIVAGLFHSGKARLLMNICRSADSPPSHYANIARGKPYTLQPAPSYAPCTDPGDAVQLTDGLYTQGFFWTQKSTVGWLSGYPIIITIDLGQVEPIRGLCFSTAAGEGEVTWPKAISVLVSDDGKNYHSAGDLIAMSGKHGSPAASGYALHRFWTDELETHGRFVQLVIDTGDGVYCFADEIEVYKGEPDWTARPLPGPATPGGLEYFKQKLTGDGIRTRLNLDIQDARAAVAASGLSETLTAPLKERIAALEAAAAGLPPENPATFRAVLPLNDIEAGLFAVRGKLRQLQGKPPLTAWVSHPYDYLSPAQEPDAAARDRISIVTMRGEFRSAVVNLTNSTERPITVRLRLEGLPQGAGQDFLKVYSVEWTDTRENTPIAAALTEPPRDRDGYRITIPAGMTRQAWLTVRAVNIAAGRYQSRVVIEQPGREPLGVPLDLEVFPFDFPAQPALHLGGWDYTDGPRPGITEANRAGLVKILQEHFVDSPWALTDALASGDFDSLDTMLPPSTERFDSWVAQWPNARRYMVFVSVGDSFAGAPPDTMMFNNRVKSWITFWVNHAAAKGISSDRLVLLLVDEPKNNRDDRIIAAWAKAIRAAQTGVVIWEDPVHKKPQLALPEMLAAVDVLTPNRVQLMAGGTEFASFYQAQRAKGRRLELYSCAEPMLLLDPYAYIRLQAWQCWAMGAEGTTFWSFSDVGNGSPWQPYITWKRYFSPLFISADAIVVGKHMEAMRESVEDYEYFIMLERALAKANPGNPGIGKAKELLATGAQRVLEGPGTDKLAWTAPKDRWEAENVRREMLQTMEILQR